MKKTGLAALIIAALSFLPASNMETPVEDETASFTTWDIWHI